MPAVKACLGLNGLLLDRSAPFTPFRRVMPSQQVVSLSQNETDDVLIATDDPHDILRRQPMTFPLTTIRSARSGGVAGPSSPGTDGRARIAPPQGDPESSTLSGNPG